MQPCLIVSYLFFIIIFIRDISSDKTTSVYANILLIFPFQMTSCNCLLPRYILQISHELYCRSLSLSYTSECQVSGTSLSVVYRRNLLFWMKDCFYENVKNSVTSLTKQNYLKCICLKEKVSKKDLDNFRSHFSRCAIITGKKVFSP